MAQTRRLAAILAVNVVGYSRLMGEDEAGTAKAVREHRDAATPIVREFGGERNARVPEGKRILYRMGVNLGDVLIDGDDILDDGVNIAARLESIAEPGGVCISGSAYDQVRGRIEADFTDLEEKELRNIARPVRVYAVKAGSAGPAPAAFVVTERSGPPRLSIVVLPFANIGRDPQRGRYTQPLSDWHSWNRTRPSLTKTQLTREDGARMNIASPPRAQ